MSKSDYYKNRYQVDHLYNQQRVFLYKFALKFTNGLMALCILYITLYFEWSPVMNRQSTAGAILEIIILLMPAVFFILMVCNNKNKYHRLKTNNTQLLKEFKQN